MSHTSPARSAFTATLPVLFGYVPLGIAFGVLFAQLGYPWYLATLMATAVYAGAAQFMAVGLLSAGAGLLEIALMTLLLNARHLFYGLSLAGRFPARGAGRWYLMFGLTDETYSLLTALPPSQPDPGFYLKVTALNQLYWVFGCTVGALLGAGLSVDTRGLEFALTALFVVMVIEQALAIRQARPFLIALVSAVIALAVAGSGQMLLVALGLATALLVLDARRQAWTPGSI